MKRIVGIFCIVLALYALVLTTRAGRTPLNHKNLSERLALYGVLTLGAGVVIVAGGIDLSIGSVVALAAISFGLMLKKEVPAGLAIAVVVAGSAAVGFCHGFLITRFRLQPFIVTLCGLFLWRGMAYWLALPDPMAPVRGLLRLLSFGALYADAAVTTGGAGNVSLAERASELTGLIAFAAGNFEVGFLDGVPVLGWFKWVPWRLFLFFGLVGLFAVLLHLSVYGRYLFATGANEQAARYAGISTDRYKVLSYVLCSVLAGMAGMLEQLEHRTASPSNTGQLYELYAITGAVLGGCSLRGGEGTVIGMVLGAAVLPLLRNLVNLMNFPTDLEYVIFGLALLGGTIADELLKRRAAARG